MKRVLLDYSILSMLSNPEIKKGDVSKNPFFAYMNREFKMQAVCFAFQLQAINIASYKRKAMLEVINMRGIANIMKDPDSLWTDEEEKILLERQQSIIDRFNKKSERISNLFSKGLANSISEDFILPGSVVPMGNTHFIDEDDLKQYNIDVIPLNKAELMRVLIYINQWKEKNPDFPISDMLLMDLITRLLSGFIKLDEWFMIDSEDRLNEMNKVMLSPDFQKILGDYELYPTLVR